LGSLDHDELLNRLVLELQMIASQMSTSKQVPIVEINRARISSNLLVSLYLSRAR